MTTSEIFYNRFLSELLFEKSCFRFPSMNEYSGEVNLAFNIMDEILRDVLIRHAVS